MIAAPLAVAPIVGTPGASGLLAGTVIVSVLGALRLSRRWMRDVDQRRTVAAAFSAAERVAVVD